MANLQSKCFFKPELQNIDQYTGGKWLIDGTKQRMNKQLQSLELLCYW